MEKERKSFILRLLVGILTVIGIIIIVCLLCSKCTKKEATEEYKTVLDSNLNKMIQAAKDYYTEENLPVNIHDAKTLKLQAMIDSDIIAPFKDADNKLCDQENSYITVTKILSTQYKVTAKLICNKQSGEKNDVIITSEENNPNELTYTVQFNTDGGNTIENQTIVQGQAIQRPTDPVKDGYTFAGWYLDNTIYNFETKINQDITLTAKWVKNTTSSTNPDNPSTSNPNTTPTKQFYYEHAPITKSYLSDWTTIYPTSSTLFDTKKEKTSLYEYHKTDFETIYTVATFTKNEYEKNRDSKGNFNIKYTIILNNFSTTNHFKFSARETQTITTTDSFQKYKDHRSNISFYGSSSQNSNVPYVASDMSQSALRPNSYTYNISTPYVKDNKVLVDISITVNSLGSTKPYEGSQTSVPIYFVGVSFNAHRAYVNEKFISSNGFDHPAAWNSVTQGNYISTQEITFYRPYTYQMDLSKAIWSTKSQVDGYQPTGKTKWQ